MKLYIFAIGGSGARVLRSLTMLLAAGVKMPEGTEIIPIILDPDKGAGNLDETLKLLKRYQEIQKQGGEQCSTFTTKISTLPKSEFDISLGDKVDKKFQEYLGMTAGMSKETQALVKALFSPENLEMGMEVGFKGNPNIGSIVLGQFEQSEVYKDFIGTLKNQAQTDQRIFIISSIFGGTGASGFPTLVKSLRGEEEAVSKLRIGALSIQPYFAVKRDEGSAIDSTTFYSKTRAALSYYLDNIINNNDVDDFYMIGDKHPDTYKNIEGGKDQRNDAHFVELASALSIFDFARKERMEDDANRKCKVYEFGIEGDNSREFSFEALGHWTRRDIAQPLVSLYLMCRYLKRNLNTSHDWLRQVKLNRNFSDELMIFLDEYVKWLKELAGQEKRSFCPIKVVEGTAVSEDKESIFDCIEGYGEKKDLSTFRQFGFNKNFDLYTQTLNKEKAPENESEFLRVLSKVSYDLIHSKTTLPK